MLQLIDFPSDQKTGAMWISLDDYERDLRNPPPRPFEFTTAVQCLPPDHDHTSCAYSIPVAIECAIPVCTFRLVVG